MKISINHSICPSLSYENFFKLAKDLEIPNVEIRNDLLNLKFDLKAINEISDLKEKYKINVISINALQKFNIWNKERKDELLYLCNAAKKINCKGIVLVPLNSGKYYEEDQRLSLLKNSLNEIDFILSDYAIKGYVEPLGFKSSSLRYKSDVIDLLNTIENQSKFSLVHDTFHHTVADDKSIYVEHTSIVHISGVKNLVEESYNFTDEMRELIDESDRIKNVEQINFFLKNKFNGFFSIEPFSEKIQKSKNHLQLIKETLKFINQHRYY